MTDTDQRENTGENYDAARQRRAQEQAWATLRHAAARIEPGMDDNDGRALVDQIIAESGAQRLWHASQVRFGPNTMLPFGKAPEKPYVLEVGDIFFLDIGPVYDGHEGDVGQGFTLGQSDAYERLIEDSKSVFEAIKDHWKTTGCSGQALYDYGKVIAQNLGRKMALEGAAGHRIGDFPHRIHHSGKLKDFGKTPSPDLWILEVHLIDPVLGAGAFYEDML